MPVQYTGILEEHRAVRERAGLFDLSHMGELFVDGDDAGDALAAALVTDPRTLAVGRAQYSMICAPDGGIIDDLIVYRLGPERFLVVANAGNATVVSDELATRLGGWRAVLDDRSLATSLVAIQGPRGRGDPGAADGRRPRRRSATTRSPRARSPASRRSSRGPATRARTGSRSSSTGSAGPRSGTALAKAGAKRRASSPCGLGARDTLRLEAGMPLYGNELDRETNPFEAGLGRVVKLEKPGDFVGRAALEKVAQDGPDEAARRAVRSRGGGSPATATRSCATARRPASSRAARIRRPWAGPSRWPTSRPRDAEPGTILAVEIREQPVSAEVVPLPFYKRAKGT